MSHRNAQQSQQRSLESRANCVQAKDGKWFLCFWVDGARRRHFLRFEFHNEQEARNWVDRVAGLAVSYENGEPVQITSVGEPSSNYQQL